MDNRCPRKLKQQPEHCKCGEVIAHRRVGLCASCYKNKRKQDWKLNEAKRQAKDPDYLANRRHKNNVAASRWQKNNRDRLNERQKIRCKNDVDFRLRRALRKRISEALKNRYKNSSAVKDLGCSIGFLRKHLESQFQPGMSWDNYGEWHIDHIERLSDFNLEDPKQFSLACHYTNLQPLWEKDHVKKTTRENKNGFPLSKKARVSS